MSAPFLQVRGFSKSYGGRVVLDGVDLEVERGQVMVLLGRSGSGKSTLLRHLAGLEGRHRPRGSRTRGEIHVEGVGDLLRLSEAALTRRRVRGPRIGMVFQSGALFDFLPVEGNLTWPLRAARVRRGESRRRAVDALARAGLPPEEYLPRRVTDLSGGERRRVAVARALVLAPELLLLDEPTAGLDPPTASGIATLTRALASSGVTCVVATHDPVLTRAAADVVAFVCHGCLQSRASLAEALRMPEIDAFLNG